MGASGDYQRVRIAPDGRQVVFDRAIETVSFDMTNDPSSGAGMPNRMEAATG